MSHKQDLVLHVDLQPKTCSFDCFTGRLCVLPFKNISHEDIMFLRFLSLFFCKFLPSGQTRKEQQFARKVHFYLREIQLTVF